MGRQGLKDGEVLASQKTAVIHTAFFQVIFRVKSHVCGQSQMTIAARSIETT